MTCIADDQFCDLRLRSSGLPRGAPGSLLEQRHDPRGAQGDLRAQAGCIDSETVIRMVIGTNGLVIAWYDNRMPKTMVPGAQVRQSRQVSVWSLVLSGIVYGGLWMLAPIPVAVSGGTGAISAGLAVTLGYCFAPRSKARAASH